MKNILFLYNPVSGEAQIVSQLDRITMYYQRAGYAVTLFRITRDRGLSHLADLIQAHQPEHLLVAGGDGTINRLVNYLKHKNVTIPIAILPMGTANDFARLIGMPDTLSDACNAILNGEVRQLDMGRVNNRYFINVFSCGLFTDVSQKTPTAMKNTFGKLAYYVSSISELPSFRKMNIEVTADEISFKGSCLLLLVFNGRTAGNLRLASHSSAEDGLLDRQSSPGLTLQRRRRSAGRTDYPGREHYGEHQKRIPLSGSEEVCPLPHGHRLLPDPTSPHRERPTHLGH